LSLSASLLYIYFKEICVSFLMDGQVVSLLYFSDELFVVLLLQECFKEIFL
jgi:hypothetical protein